MPTQTKTIPSTVSRRRRPSRRNDGWDATTTKKSSRFSQTINIKLVWVPRYGTSTNPAVREPSVPPSVFRA